MGEQSLLLLRVQQIDLVQDFDDRPVFIGLDAEFDQNCLHVVLLGFGLVMRGIADMQDDIRLQHLFQRGAEGRDQFVRQIRDEAHRVGQDHAPPVRQAQAAHGGIERGEQEVLRHHVGMGQLVEQRGLAGVGIADQRDDGIRHLLARRAMKPARALHLFDLLANLGEAFADQAPVGFDLGFTGATEEAKAAALALQVGPGPHQPRTLISEMRQLNLQPAFPRLRAFAEDFEDERGAVQHLGVPRFLQIALLHRR